MLNTEVILYLLIFISVFAISSLLMGFLLNNPVQKRLRRIAVENRHKQEVTLKLILGLTAKLLQIFTGLPVLQSIPVL